MKRRHLELVAILALAVVAVTVGLLLREPPDRQGRRVTETSPTVDRRAPRDDVPGVTTDDARPSPASSSASAAPEGGLRLIIPRAGIDADAVVLGVDAAGVMQSPVGPKDVGWYNFSSRPGEGGNVVLSGHVDYVNYGPGVFWRLRELRADDEVEIALDDGSLLTYRVTMVSLYEAQTAPVQEIIGRTDAETVTLITCSGAFDSASREYDKRLVVRAVRV